MSLKFGTAFELKDIQVFVERFIKGNKREISRDPNGKIEFLTPEALEQLFLT